MISYSKIDSPAAALTYYQVDAKNVGEYYSQEEAPSQWGGRGAELAGFESGARVDPKEFEQALEGRFRLPDSPDAETQQLGALKNGHREHAPGIDFTVSAPKSFSIAALVGEDIKIAAAHEVAVQKAMQYLERYAETRVRTQDYGIEYRRTNNLAYSSFTHDTNRENEPQLHTHNVVHNATFDEKSGKWRSLEPNSLVQRLSIADAVYKNELAIQARAAGYEIAWTKNGPEIAGISREQIEAFSTRLAQVDQKLQNAGLTRETATAGERSRAALATRRAKDRPAREENQARWAETARNVGINFERLRAGSQIKPHADNAREIVLRAIEHLSERDAAFTREALIRSSLDFAKDKVDFDRIERTIDKMLVDRDVLRDRAPFYAPRSEVYTTQKAVELEVEAGQMLVKGRSAVDPILRKTETALALTQYNEELQRQHGFDLNAGQQQAAQMILSTTNRFTAIQGHAGTGKTTMLQSVRRISEQHQTQIIGLSSGSNQVQVLERETGIKSHTVASWLIEVDKQREEARLQGQATKLHERFSLVHKQRSARLHGYLHSFNKKHGIKNCPYEAELALLRQSRTGKDGATDRNHQVDAPKNKLIVVDEASMLSQDDMNKIMRNAEYLGAKVVFIGDKHQHESVGAGAAFTTLQQEGVETAYLTQINRQKDDIGKQAVRDIFNDFSGHRPGDALRVTRTETVHVRMHDEAVESNPIVGRTLATVVNTRTNATQEVLLSYSAKAETNETIVVTASSENSMQLAVRGETVTVHSGTATAFRRLDVRENGNNEELIANLAKHYAVSPDRQETIVVTATNVDRRAINEGIRNELRDRGMLGEESINVVSLRKIDLSAEERRDASSYKAGMVVRSDRTYRVHNIAKGQLLRVETVNEEKNTLRLLDDLGRRIVVNPRINTGFHAFETETLELRAGDKIRFTGKYEGIANGDFGIVDSVSDGKATLKLQHQTVTLAENSHWQLNHGYAMTSFGAQGATQKKAIIHLNTERGVTNARSFYVAATRAKEGTTIFTTNREKARRMISRDRGNMTALVRDDRAEKPTNRESASMRI